MHPVEVCGAGKGHLPVLALSSTFPKNYIQQVNKGTAEVQSK